MRATCFHLSTTKETPADADIVSHQLMLRAGLIQKLGAGLYSWLPLGLRVLRNVEAAVRAEMDRIGCQELLMPAVQPAELWQESGRWSKYGPELLRIQDRHERDFCFGPTHEEVITDLVRRELRSYRQLPASYYQIQTKFRDETRPRFGVMRAREFLMKDAYSFHLDDTSLDTTYQDMRAAYARIFERLGLNFRAVRADTGAIGGSMSEEFHVLADSGEDEIAACDRCDYAANTELAESRPELPSASNPESPRQEHTPAIQTVDEQAEALGLSLERIVKSVVVMADGEPVVVFMTGDDELNEAKLERALTADDIRLAEPDEAQRATGSPRGFIGPVDLPAGRRCLVDHRAASLTNFSSGANRADYHWVNLNWGRDAELPASADLRSVRAGESCPHCEGTLSLTRGIEVGHIFKLGTGYSEAMEASVLDESGREVTMTMGCYGIGISRVVAAAIEQNHDDSGIIWPEPLAPFRVALVTINAHKSRAVAEAAEELYQRLQEAGMEPFFDDREARPGVKFADMELIGIPHRVVVAERGLEAGTVEYRGRSASENEAVALNGIIDHLRERMG
jgi:prolyl-tRNA synthetase